MSLEVDHSLGAFEEIQVAVAPVGQISSDDFSFYSQFLRSFSRLQLSRVTRYSANGQVSPFPHHSWNDSHVVFKFVSLDRQRSDWETVHMHRKILGLIGICSCRVPQDIIFLHSEFVSMRQNYRTCLVHRLLIFDPQRNTGDVELPYLVMIPNVERGDLRQLKFYVQTLMCDVASELINCIEKIVIDMDHSVSPSSPMDAPEAPVPAVGSSSVTTENLALRKRRGRIAKVIADWALLAGSPNDAISQCTAALELLRPANDHLWYAAALEAHCAALLLCNRNPTQSNIDVISMLSEAVSMYAKANVHSLLVECSIALSRQLQIMGRRVEAVNTVTEAFVASKEMSVQNKILLAGACAVTASRAKFNRKFIFFVAQTAKLYEELYQWSASHSLMVSVSRHFNLFPLENDSCTSDPQEETVARENRLFARNQNQELQIAILSDLIASSQYMNDPRRIVAYTAYLLRAMHHGLSSSRQLAFSERLMDTTQALPRIRNVSMAGFPFVLGVRYCQPSEELKVFKTSSSKQETGVFIYSPFERKAKEKRAQKRSMMSCEPEEERIWVAGEIGRIDVLLSNTSGLDLTLSLSLATAELPFHAYGTECCIRANSSMTVSCRGKPLASGQLRLYGVSIINFQIEHVHSVDSQGRGLVLPFSLPKSNISREFHIFVVPPQAILSVRSVSDHVSLCDGEQRQISMRLENRSTVEMSLLDFSLRMVPDERHFDPEVVRRCQEAICVDFCSEEIAKSFPLKGGDGMTLNLSVRASLPHLTEDEMKFSSRAELFFRYFSGSESFSRLTRYSLSLCVERTIVLSHFDVLPTYTISHVPLNDESVFSYDLSLSSCVVSLRNVSSHDVTICYGGELEIAGGNVAAGSIVGEREVVKQLTNECVRRLNAGNAVRVILSRVRTAIVDAHALFEHPLRWRTSWTQGIVRLGEIDLSAGMIRQLTLPELSCVIRTPLSSGQLLRWGDASFPVHSVIPLRLLLRNEGESPIGPLSVVFRPYRRGSTDVLQDSIAWIGRTSAVIAKIPAHAAVEHALAVCFLKSGCFELSLRVTCDDQDVTYLNASFKTVAVK